MEIEEILSEIKILPGCMILPPSGMPKIEKNHYLPDDLKKFYELCGGLVLFKYSDYAIRIVSANEVVRANPIIIGEIPDIPNNGIQIDDISEDWYIIADDFNGDYLTIDFSPERLGRCYDSSHELHPGNSKIIAQSFNDLLVRLIKTKGNYWYWLRKDFDSMGSAYDD